MPWQQLILQVDAAELPRAETLLELAGAAALSLAGGDDSALLEPEPGETPLWPRVSLRALFAADKDLRPIARLLREELRSQAHVEVSLLSDEQWIGGGRAFAAQHIGQRLLVAPADQPQLEPAAALLRLHMGLAFGTGEHPTTRLCLEWLDAHLRAGARVLDYGAGSGVLALAALALGAHRAWAVDVDPQALRATADNARLNARGEELWVGLPAAFEELEAASGGVDVLVANILAGPLEALAAPFGRYLAAGGSIVLSGLLESQCDAVEAAFRPGFSDFERSFLDGWARVTARRL